MELPCPAYDFGVLKRDAGELPLRTVEILARIKSRRYRRVPATCARDEQALYQEEPQSGEPTTLSMRVTLLIRVASTRLIQERKEEERHGGHQ